MYQAFIVPVELLCAWKRGEKRSVNSIDVFRGCLYSWLIVFTGAFLLTCVLFILSSLIYSSIIIVINNSLLLCPLYETSQA